MHQYFVSSHSITKQHQRLQGFCAGLERGARDTDFDPFYARNNTRHLHLRRLRHHRFVEKEAGQSAHTQELARIVEVLLWQPQEPLVDSRPALVARGRHNRQALLDRHINEPTARRPGAR